VLSQCSEVERKEAFSPVDRPESKISFKLVLQVWHKLDTCIGARSALLIMEDDSMSSGMDDMHELQHPRDELISL
jgi:hypothetical protein